MANIDPYIEEIQNARYGEEVRGSIINALKKVNDDNESYVGIKNEIEDIYNALTLCVEITLDKDSWESNRTQTVSVEGILADESEQLIEIVPKKDTLGAYIESNILCISQAENSLTFRADVIPEINVNAFVVLRNNSGTRIDNTLDVTSMNPIQNKPVAEAVEGIRNDLADEVAKRDRNNFPIDDHAVGYIKLQSYVWENGGQDWTKLITAPSDGYLYISTSNRTKIRMSAKLFPADFTEPGGALGGGDDEYAFPSISIGAYQPTMDYGDTTLTFAEPSTACIFVRKGMKIGLFRDYDGDYSNAYCGDGGAKFFTSNLANALFFPLTENMEHSCNS